VIPCEARRLCDPTTGQHLERCPLPAAFSLEAMIGTWSVRVCCHHLVPAIQAAPDPVWKDRPAGTVRVSVIPAAPRRR